MRHSSLTASSLIIKVGNVKIKEKKKKKNSQ